MNVKSEIFFFWLWQAERIQSIFPCRWILTLQLALQLFSHTKQQEEFQNNKKATTKLQKPASPNHAGRTSVACHEKSIEFAGFPVPHHRKVALPENSSIPSAQCHQWQTETSLKFQYTDHVPILISISTVHSTLRNTKREVKSKYKSAVANKVGC